MPASAPALASASASAPASACSRARVRPLRRAMTRPRSSLCESSHQRASHLDAGWFHRLLTYDICAFALIVFVFGALHLYACVTLHHITSLHITHYTLHITSPYITLHRLILHCIILYYITLHYITTTAPLLVRACVRVCVRREHSLPGCFWFLARPMPPRGVAGGKKTPQC